MPSDIHWVLGVLCAMIDFLRLRRATLFWVSLFLAFRMRKKNPLCLTRQMLILVLP